MRRHSLRIALLFAILLSIGLFGAASAPATASAQEECDWWLPVYAWDENATLEFVPDKDGYCEGEAVEVTCRPNEGYRFSGWTWHYPTVVVPYSPTSRPATLTEHPIANNEEYYTSYICDVVAAPSETDLSCKVPISISGGGAVYVNSVRADTVLGQEPSIFHMDALQLDTEAFEGWNLSGFTTATNCWGPGCFGQIIYAEMAEFPEEGINPCWHILIGIEVTFAPTDGSGEYWVGSWVHPVPNATISRDVNKTGYDQDEIVNLTCEPDEGYRFVEWKSTYRDSDTPVFTDAQALEVQVDGNSFHECHVEAIQRTLHTEAVVKPDSAPQYTDNALISVEPDTGGTYAHGTYIEITAATPNVSGQQCTLDWYWYVPDVSPDWHLLPDHNQTIPVIMDHDKWVRAEWVCAKEQPTPTPTATPPTAPTEAPTPLATDAPAETATPTSTREPAPDTPVPTGTPTPTAIATASPEPSGTPTPVSAEGTVDVYLPIGR